MMNFSDQYNSIRAGRTGFYKMPRGLFEVSGSEAVQFLNGLITNDVAKLEDGGEMHAAFPTLKGRIFAIVRVKNRGGKFLIETEEGTRQKVYDNLFRFTFAGDFHLEDLSGGFEFFRTFGKAAIEHEEIIAFGRDYFIPSGSAAEFKQSLGDAVEITDDVYKVLRIEEGIPKYGIDMDEETVVPEIGLEGLISYQKGCYIGQEVIARIHFRGKPAKHFRGLIIDAEGEKFDSNETAVKALEGSELVSDDGKNAGFITSAVYSPKLRKMIALGYVRNAFAGEGTQLRSDENRLSVAVLPFI
ncbi:MAG: glycine cleavage T C-terminal barrel domain-containing protein [Pyrinomonadaceae bacterium]